MINSCYHLLIEDDSLVRRDVACKEYLPLLIWLLFLIHLYLEFLLESNAKGSFQQVLIENEFITHSSVESQHSNTLYWFEIKLHLTKLEVDHYQRVIQMFFLIWNSSNQNPFKLIYWKKNWRIEKREIFLTVLKPKHLKGWLMLLVLCIDALLWISILVNYNLPLLTMEESKNLLINFNLKIQLLL